MRKATPPNTARNQEIALRVLAGEPAEELASDCHISRARIYQIAWREIERALTDAKADHIQKRKRDFPWARQEFRAGRLRL